MADKDSLEKIMEKSRKLFLSEQKTKINSAFAKLLSYRLHKKDEDWSELKRFFHSIRGTASTLKLEALAVLGEKYEEYIISNSNNSLDAQVSTILEGLGKVYEELEKPELNLSSPSPVATDLPQNSMPVDETKLDENFRANRILVVDDDAAMLDMLDKTFSSEGYEVVITSDPKQVIETLKNGVFDVILLDVVMPEKDGFVLLKQIRSECINTPVIFLTVKDDIKFKVGAFEWGAEDYLIKPFQPEELIARVAHVIKKANSNKKLIYIDKATGAYTTEFFSESLKAAKWRQTAKSEEFCVALIDIDHFKEANKLYGYAIGNYILDQFVKQLKSRMLLGEQICRIRDDEFAILLPNSNAKMALIRLETIKNEIRSKYFYKDGVGPLEISFSGSITSSYGEDEGVLELLEKLRLSLEDAKKAGIGKIVLCQIQQPNKPVQKGPKKLIVVIDDESTITYLVKQRLESLGYDVYTAADGESGLQRCVQMKPDLAIVDLMLPKLDGFEVCKVLKSNPILARTKIIVLTSSSKKEYVARCVQIGVDSFMVKPFSLLDIGNRVKGLLG